MNKALSHVLLCKRNTDEDLSEHHRKQVNLFPCLFPLVPSKFPCFLSLYGQNIIEILADSM